MSLVQFLFRCAVFFRQWKFQINEEKNADNKHNENLKWINIKKDAYYDDSAIWGKKFNKSFKNLGASDVRFPFNAIDFLKTK